jgi:L-fuconolactonase
MIDAHVHFWNYHTVRDAWITDEMKLLQRDFLPTDLTNEIKENNVEGVVAVQADPSDNETLFLLNLSEKNPVIKGVVGWIDLQHKYVEKKLLYYSNVPIIKGFRHIVQSEPKGFLLNEKFLNGIQYLHNFQFTYDILIYENQLQEAIEFVNKFPSQKFIIDHCAKPSIKNKSINEWKQLMKVIAQNENVFCKISGLITEATWSQWNDEAFYPYLDAVFDFFGTGRILFGSDWPVMLLSGNYLKWKKLVEQYMEPFSAEQKQKVFRENAIAFYNLTI